MNAAETIQAAIDKLEALSHAGSPAPWDYAGQGWVRHGDTRVGSDQFPEVLAATTRNDEDGVLIETLHRTIDAQLAILRAAAGAGISEMVVTNPERFKGAGAALYRTAFDLARAILGEVS